jgi:hypothetical protein
MEMEDVMSFAALKQFAGNSNLPLVKWAYDKLRHVYGLVQNAKRRRAPAHTQRLADQDIEKTIVFAIQYARSLEPGDIAEFGVFNGRYAMTEARELAAYSSTRAIHLFDSWSGYGAFDQKDKEAPEVKSGEYNSEPRPDQVPPDVLLRRLERIYRGPFHIYKGFFKDTVATIRPGTRFVMIVMDGNLFSSTDTVLNHLFANEHVAEGAVLLFPGWNLGRASPDQLVRKA